MSLPPGGQTYSPPESDQRTDSKQAPDFPRSRRAGLIAGSVVIVVVIAGVVGGIALRSGDPAPSDTQRIDTAIRDFYDALNAGGPAQAVTTACAQDRIDFEAIPADQRTAMDRNRFTVSIDAVEDIAITGDRATATVRGSMAPTASPQAAQASNAQQHLREEDGAWKVCSADELR
ncbi:hypothetical protein HLB23_10760 [Nocardia uniformis]|uniref:DUF4878 domain-containing protein n=1 Tax=Nocardia uniformis TaxID=53432 RepID=A0A849C601_9NOCA|nr:hypothetical protein [Nocardia uniformis]NNH70339.1 hypothetical protein [Nocardia uniformis]